MMNRCVEDANVNIEVPVLGNCGERTLGSFYVALYSRGQGYPVEAQAGIYQHMEDDESLASIATDITTMRVIAKAMLELADEADRLDGMVHIEGLSDKTAPKAATKIVEQPGQADGSGI